MEKRPVTPVYITKEARTTLLRLQAGIKQRDGYSVPLAQLLGKAISLLAEQRNK